MAAHTISGQGIHLRAMENFLAALDSAFQPFDMEGDALWQLHALCHKLHSAISPSILHRFSRSQWLRKALKKTFRSVPVMSRGDQ